MNILFLYLPAIAPTRGGVERVTDVLADAFEKRGHHCFYLATIEENRDVAHPTRQFFLPNLEKTNVPENLEFYKNFLRERQIDIVVWQGAHKKFPFEKFAGHPPIISVLHLDPCAYVTIVRDKFAIKRARGNAKKQGVFFKMFDEILIRAKIFLRRLKKNKVYRQNYSVCDKYVVLSSNYVKTLTAHLLDGKDWEKKVVAIPNPLSVAETQNVPVEKENILLFVGRMCLTQKRPDLMLRVWKLLEDKFPNWRLEMLGSGDDDVEIKQLARELNLQRVCFRGFTDAIPFFEKSPILCMTSSNEGFPMVLAEASSFNCVPVAFDSFLTAHDILENNKNGFLVPAFDLEKYAKTLEKLMTDHALRERLANAARENAKRFEIDKICEQWLKLFNEVLKSGLQNISKSDMFR